MASGRHAAREDSGIDEGYPFADAGYPSADHRRDDHGAYNGSGGYAYDEGYADDEDYPEGEYTAIVGDPDQIDDRGFRDELFVEDYDRDYELDEFDADLDAGSLDSMLSSSNEAPADGEDYQRRRRPWAGWALLVVFVLVVAGGGVWLHDVVTRPPAPEKPTAPGFTIAMQDPTPGSVLPAVTGPIPAAVAGPENPQVAWANRISTITYIPQRAMNAYLNAQLVMAQSDPGCHLSWATVAGVGWVESQHGQYEGDSIGANGDEVNPIIGPALDGTDGMRKVPATDGGTLDGDKVWAHAVGPMQFLPATWLQYGLRASADGRAPDPQNFADSALTTGNYLCATGGDLSVAQNWWQAVYVYNNSLSYGQEVFSAADAYAKATR